MTNDARNKLLWNLMSTSRTLKGSANRRGAVAATLNLCGLRIAAAADSYFSQKGLESNVADRWRQLKRTPKDIGAEVNRTLDELSQLLDIPALAHHPDFRVFDDVLNDAISSLDVVEIRVDGQADLLELSEALDGYVEFQDHRNENAPFRTSHALNMLLASLLVPNDREVTSVYDPACGFGGSLIAVHSELWDQGAEKGVRFYGQDTDSEAVSVAAWRFLLRGIIDFELEVGDTLLEPRFREGEVLQRFDAVVSVPPLYPTAAKDLDKHDPFQRFRYGAVSAGRADYAFVQHVLASTAPGGRAATTLALSTLSRSGYEEEIRRRLIHADLLETVIGLPIRIISAANGSFTPSSVLLFDLAKPATSRDKFFFIDAHNIAARSKQPLPSRAQDKIVQIYAPKRERPDLSSWASLEDLKAHNYSLLPPLYIPQTPPALPTMDTLEARIEELDKDLKKTLGEFDAALSVIRNGE